MRIRDSVRSKAGRIPDATTDLDALRELLDAGGAKLRTACRFSFATQRRLVDAGMIEVGRTLADSVRITDVGRAHVAAKTV